MSSRLLALSALLCASVHAGGGGTHPYEWGGLFETPDNKYFWQAEKVDGDYADPKMDLVLCDAGAYTKATAKATLEGTEEDGETALTGTCTAKSSGDTLTPTTGCTCYQLDFDATNHLSIYEIDTTGVDGVAFWAEHVPTEFERNSHYLKDLDGEDIEPDAEAPEEESKSKPWGKTIGAAIIVNLITFSGVVFIVPIFAQFANNNPKLLSVCINAFAAGALLAAAFYLMLYEATHLIKPDDSSEADQTAYWGSMILLGFLSTYVIDVVASLVTGKGDNSGKTASTSTLSNEEKDPEAIVATVSMLDPGRKIRVLSGIILGDFMHNFVDGIFIGLAFMGCGDSMGWSITAATIYHEIAQEVSDYLVLTDPYQCGLKVWQALLFNFLSGTSVILGALVILGQNVTNTDLGLLLAFGGGIYMQIGAAECMPRMAANADSVQLRCLSLFIFFLGCFGIGMVLLDHEHCSPDGGHAH